MADAPKAGWTKQHEKLARRARKKSWAAWCAEIEAEKGHAICGRISTQRQAPCRKRAGSASRHGKLTPHPGQGACGDHGGLSPIGPANHAWKDGASSKYRDILASKLGAHLQRLEGLIGDAFDLTSEAQLLDARLVDVVSTLPEGGRVTGGELGGLRDEIRTAMDSGEAAKLIAAVARLDELVARAAGGDASWREWARLVEQKRKLVDTHTRQKAREHGPVTWPDIAFVVAHFREGVQQHVPPEAIPAFVAWMRKLQGHPALTALGMEVPPADLN